jgi:REP element-mobilizing transposase RayT
VSCIHEKVKRKDATVFSFDLTMSSDSRVYYHVTMQPYRRLPALYDEVEILLRDWIAEFTRGTEFNVLEVGVVPTHIHLLIDKAPWADLIKFINDFQAQSSERIFAKFPELMRNMKTDRFWTDGGFHYVKHDEESRDTVQRYIREQKKHHGLE